MNDDPSGPSDPAGGSGSYVASDRGSAMDSTATRTVAAFALSLALVSFLCAAFIGSAYGAVDPAIGAAALGLGFVAVVAVSRVASPILLELLADAWAEHRRYVWFATGLFGFGALVGVALFAAGVDLLDVFVELFEDVLEEELSDDSGGSGTLGLDATFFIVNNTPPFLIAMFGALTLGLVTGIVMVFNGLLLANVALAIGSEVGFGLIIVLLVPHGIFELPALFVAAGVGFRFLHRAIQRVAGTREALFTRGYLARTAALVVFAWLVLVLAAFVEAYVTVAIAELLFPGLGAEGGTDQPVSIAATALVELV